MRLSIGGYSFHLLFESGQQDIVRYITDCKRFGATQLDAWNEQFALIQKADDTVKVGPDPLRAQLTAEDKAYLARVRKAADDAGLPFGCIAVDGAHLYEPTPEAREENRRLADRWLDVARILGAPQVRIDAGGPEEMPDDIFELIVAGYKDLLARAAAKGIEVLMENHWGPSLHPENVVRILEAVDGLGLLFDTNNWAPGVQERGWELCARFARSSHFKTFQFDEAGNDPSVNLHKAVRLLVESGYDGCWGIESCPVDGDEYGAVEKTAALIRRSLKELGALEA
jgi:hypothetical protein